MDDDTFKVKFKAIGFETRIDARDTESAKELFTRFLKSKNVDLSQADKVEFEIDSNGKKIKFDCKDKLIDIGISDDTIIKVNDTANVFPQLKDRPKKARVGGKKVVDKKEEEKENETMLTVVRDMAIFGFFENEKILKDQSDKNHEFISVDDALQLKDKDEQGFVLGLMGKYLKNLEMSVAINLSEEGQDKKNQKASHSTLQFLANGMITKRKIKLIFDTEQSFVNNINQDKGKNKKFNESLKDLLIKEFSELHKDTTVFTNYPIKDKFKAMLITLKEQDIDFTDSKLQRAFKYQSELAGKAIDYEEDIPLMEGIVLSKSFLLSAFDNKSDDKWGYNETRGKEKYIPPVGWIKYGVKCAGLYGDNDDWIACDHRKGEWCIGYMGLRKQQVAEKLVLKHENDDDSRHNGQKVGIGVYTYQDPKDMEKDCDVIKYKKEEYLIGFMVRVNPEAIKIPSKDHKYWVVDGTSSSLRPVGILLKKIK